MMAGFSSFRVPFCCAAFSFGTGLVPIWAGQTCRVTSVSDGDTITALCDGVSTRIRLSSVDAPEKDQPYGDEATRVTAQLVLERDATIDVVDIDRYGRTVARVSLPDGRDLASELVKAGAAWHYVRYSKDPALGGLEAVARQAKVGLWAEPAPVEPSAFRQAKRRERSVDGMAWDTHEPDPAIQRFFTFRLPASHTAAYKRATFRRSERRTLVRGR